MDSISAIQYALKLNQVILSITKYFAYSAPWLALACNILALIILFVRRRVKAKRTLMLFLFKWQYVIGTLFVLNMILLDMKFAVIIFGYNLNNNSPDVVCKLYYFFMHYLYCLPFWMQVIMACDRFWSIYLHNAKSLPRNKANLTYLMLVIFGVVFLGNLVQMWYYATALFMSAPSTNESNSSTELPVYISYCTQPNAYILIAQGIVYNVVRTIVPFVLMLLLSAAIVFKIYQSRGRVSKSSLSSSSSSSQGQTTRHNHEHKFTVAVCLINATFLLTNLPLVIYFVLSYYIFFTTDPKNFSLSQQVEFNFFQTIALVFSYSFSLLEFVRDCALNRLFRKEVVDTFHSFFVK